MTNAKQPDANQHESTTERPTTEPLNCAEQLKALSDPTRLAVVQQLMRQAQTVSELNESLQQEQSLLSHHLQVLRKAGIAETTREGKSIRYQLADKFKSSQTALDLGCCQLSFD